MNRSTSSFCRRFEPEWRATELAFARAPEQALRPDRQPLRHAREMVAVDEPRIRKFALQVVADDRRARHSTRQIDHVGLAPRRRDRLGNETFKMHEQPLAR